MNPANDRLSIPDLFGGAAAGLLVFGLFDLVLGLLTTTDDASIGVAGAGALIVLGHVGAVGLIGGVALAAFFVIARVVERLLSGRLDGVLWLSTGLLAAGFLWIHVDTLQGDRLRRQSWYEAFLWAFRICAPVALLIALAIFRSMQRRSRSSRVGTALLVAVVLGLALACLVANVKILVGLYPGFHVQQVGFAILLCVFGAVLALRGRHRLHVAAALICTLLVLASLGVRRGENARAAMVAALSRGPATQEFTVFTEDTFRRVVPPPTVEAIRYEGDVLRAGDPEAEARAAEFLDKAVPGRGRMNVLAIAMDTVRADHVGFLGYDRKATPNLDRIAGESFVFTRCYTPYPTSNYAYASFLSGLYPRATPTYGVMNRLDWTFPPEVTVAGALGAKGWKTVGIPAFGREAAEDRRMFGMLAEGFEIYNPEPKSANAPASHVTDAAAAVIRNLKPRPFFMWAHYIDPHSPYEMQEGFEFDGTNDLVDAYDSEIAYTDHQIGRLLKVLEERDELDNTILVIFSDHGEAFGEHGRRYHNSQLYEEQVRVPLLIRIPGLEGRRIESVVSLVDIVPSLLALLRVDDSLSRHGRNLLPVMLGGQDDGGGIAHIEHFHKFGGHLSRNQRAVVRGNDKLIWRRLQDVFELYDLGADPAETRNLVGRADELERRMRGVLENVDDTIDSYHAAGNERSPREEYLGRLDEALAALTEAGGAGTKAASEVPKLLFNYVGDPSPRAARYLGDDGLDALAARLEKDWGATKDRQAKRRILSMILRLRRPRSAPLLREQVKVVNIDTVKVARALALMGDDAGRAVLELTSDSPVTDRRIVWVARAHLGDEKALALAMPIFTGPGWDHVANMLEAMPLHRPEDFPRWVRDFPPERLWKAPPIQQKLAQVSAALPPDPQNVWTTLLLTLAEDGLVVEEAEKALVKMGVDAKRLAELRVVAEFEVAGDEAIQNFKFDAGYDFYRKALERGRSLEGDLGLNPGLRLRFARYLHLRGLRDEARGLLESVRDGAVREFDRRVATRRLATLAAPARITDPSTFGAEVSVKGMPDRIRTRCAAPILITIKNTGSVPWQGGYWRYANSVEVVWRGADGKLMNQGEWRAPRYLPDEGVLPGEEISLPALVLPAPVREYRGTPVIVFRQWGLKLPGDGVLWENPSPVEVSPRLK